MRGAVIHGPRDVCVENRAEPQIIHPTDAIIRLWAYRGVEAVAGPSPIGHEYCGIVEEVGAEVTSVRPGRFVIGTGESRLQTSAPPDPAATSATSASPTASNWTAKSSSSPMSTCTAVRLRCASNLPQLAELIWNRKFYPGKVFDLELPLDKAAEAYRAMDEHRAFKALLRPQRMSHG